MNIRSGETDNTDNTTGAEDSDVWHEFTNQLGIVAAFSELLLADPNADTRRRVQLTEISRAADRVLALVPRLRATK